MPFPTDRSKIPFNIDKAEMRARIFRKASNCEAVEHACDIADSWNLEMMVALNPKLCWPFTKVLADTFRGLEDNPANLNVDRRAAITATKAKI